MCHFHGWPQHTLCPSIDTGICSKGYEADHVLTSWIFNTLFLFFSSKTESNIDNVLLTSFRMMLHDCNESKVLGWESSILHANLDNFVSWILLNKTLDYTLSHEGWMRVTQYTISSKHEIYIMKVSSSGYVIVMSSWSALIFESCNSQEGLYNLLCMLIAKMIIYVTNPLSPWN